MQLNSVRHKISKLRSMCNFMKNNLRINLQKGWLNAVCAGLEQVTGIVWVHLLGLLNNLRRE